jgi:hypothetical protein
VEMFFQILGCVYGRSAQCGSRRQRSTGFGSSSDLPLKVAS